MHWTLNVHTFSLEASFMDFARRVLLRGALLVSFRSLSLVYVTLFGPTFVALAEEVHATEQEITTETIQMPKAIEYGTLQYPRRALSRAEEGWVYLHFMVDTNGSAYYISVADRSGSVLFEDAAIKALKGTKFRPGEYNGEKIDHGYNMQYTFEMQDKKALFASSFKRRFYEVVNAIATKQKTKAEDGLEILRDRRRTLHEDAMYWIAKYYFDQAWGTVSEQLQSVSRALGHDRARRYMDTNLHQRLLWSKLLLQLEQKKYISASTTIERFIELKEVDEALLQKANELKRAIDDLKSSSSVISAAGKISSNGDWSYELIRNRFSVVDVKGVVEEMTLTCQRDRLRFRFKPDHEYSYNQSSGTCRVAVVGDPGTSFTFIQL